MADYTSNLNLFKPGSDDNLGVEQTLSDNFVAIDDKLGSALTDLNGTKFTTLKQRIDAYQSTLNNTTSEVDILKTRQPNVKLNDHFVRVVAYRGLKGSAPENTEVSYRMAAELGVYGIWFDVRRTSDARWVCMADATVDRTTNGTGNVKNMTYSQIKSLDAGAKFHVSFADTRVPSLEEALEVCRSHQVVPYIYVPDTHSDTELQSLINKLIDYDLINDCVIISGVYTNLTKIRVYDKAVALAYYSTSHTTQVLDNAKSLGNAFVVYPNTVVDSTVHSEAKSKGVKIDITVTNSSTTHSSIKSLLKYGIRGFITDKAFAVRGL